MTTDPATSDSETIARTTHQEQDEAIRQGNRQKAQQQKAPASANGQSSLLAADHQRAADLANRQTGPVTGESQGAAEEANREESLSRAQEQEAEKAAKREDSMQRTQAVVSPFTKATVHRQIGGAYFLSMSAGMGAQYAGQLCINGVMKNVCSFPQIFRAFPPAKLIRTAKQCHQSCSFKASKVLLRQQSQLWQQKELALTQCYALCIKPYATAPILLHLLYTQAAVLNTTMTNSFQTLTPSSAKQAPG